MRPIAVHRLGRASYGPVHELQQRLQLARVAGDIGDTVLFVEHSPVITLGRGAKLEHLLLTRELLAAKGIEVHDVGRGGDVTYHGPGQVVMYPIIDLNPDRRDVRKYVASLEETMILTCTDYGLRASRITGMNGTWVENRKIGAVGVRISRWVTMHGLALNVSTDLSHFALIVPCGIRGKAVTSLAHETQRSIPLAEIEERLMHHFASLFDAEISWFEGPPKHLLEVTREPAMVAGLLGA